MHTWKNGTCKRRIVSLLTVASAQAAELLVSSFNTNQVLRYEEATGAFLGALVAAGVTRNPGKALEVTVPFGPIDDGTFEPGDELSLIISARIGTNPNGNKCPGHSNAVGLRLSYDATHRPSRFGAELAPELLTEFFLHSNGGDFLDEVAPTAPPTRDFKGKTKDSPVLNFKNGNPWRPIGTWSLTLP